jgi:hypothetical protein
MREIWDRFKRKWNNSLQYDKQAHFKLGAILGVITLSGIWLGVAGYCGAMVIAQLVAYGLELYQSTTKNRHVEANDAYATVAGFVYVWCILVVISELIRFVISHT